MKFADLLLLPFNTRTGLISVEAIVEALPGTPAAVAQQFYADHGRKPDHQEAYGSLQLNTLSWSLVGVEAASLMDASTLPAFQNWFSNVGERVTRFDVAGWQCIDSRADVQRHWAEHGTWLVPPVVLTGAVVGSSAALHVAEGHTRIGLLRGLARAEVLPASSRHMVWIGSTA
ncbi:hypothetical protein LXT12_26445 [Pelomonas sp. P7]|uniref:Uncharacterized protein n=1 Tax=Pelomonas caseinilytica TaxID=2906763 RepID=A0ABS8XIV7_9BURK|nr:hypothetical protein [Pelomonas sp. P7]MCE4540774.1 hypothetical protein [Pelomonas sp. P7]